MKALKDGKEMKLRKEVLYGSVLLLFYGTIVVSSWIHGDLYLDYNITKGDIEARLPGMLV